ncbi:hypothetical protein Trco_007120 [Trichoderma cornu-damae]|uniref:Uncharacterized protein n=1 Tax=Trichoderma cornu-damae TaxID=654480 RepID=A0A9P8QMK6_9HYPO|nr:hypothetical protein Trco_007120 [Trichoderma cornu-damae]
MTKVVGQRSQHITADRIRIICDLQVDVAIVKKSLENKRIVEVILVVHGGQLLFRRTATQQYCILGFSISSGCEPSCRLNREEI